MINLSPQFAIALIILLILELLTIIRNIKSKEYDRFFWFCDMGPLLVIIGILSGNIQYLKGVISIGLLPQLFTMIWLVIDISGKDKPKNIWSVKKRAKFYIALSFLLHIITINLALAITISTKANGVSLIYSLLILMMIFALSYKFTDHKKNINFIHHLDFLSYRPKYYTYLWIILSFLVIVLPTFLIQNLIVRLFA